MKPRALTTGVLLAVLLGTATLGGQWLGARLFVRQQKLPVTVTSIFTLRDYYRVWGHVPNVRRSLQQACVLAALPPLAVMGTFGLALFPRRRELHGSARFASLAEIRRSGLLDPDPASARHPALLLGQYRGQYLTFHGQQFAVVAAPTRSGKGVSLIIPNLLHYPHSVVVNDTKLENYRMTAGFRRAHGQAVYCFSPDHPELRSHRWNPLDYVRRDPNWRVGDILRISNLLYPTPLGMEGTSLFFNNAAQMLFLGLVLYCLDTPGEPCTLPHLLQLTTPLSGEPLPAWMRRTLQERASAGTFLSLECSNAWYSFLANDEETLANILATLVAPLNLVRDPGIAAALSASDFDLRDVRRTPMSIYIGIQPGNLDRFARLINLFFSQLITENTAELPENNPALSYQCLLLMDEFTAMGRVGIIQSAVSFMAGYNLRLFLVFQNLSQLDTHYQKEGRKTLMTNMAAHILFAPRDNDDAREYSDMLGYCTEKAISRSRNRGKTTSHGESQSDQRRALLLPQEVRQIGQARAIVSLENEWPILADKITWYSDPVLRRRGNDLQRGVINYPTPDIPKLLMPPPPPVPNPDLTTVHAEPEPADIIAAVLEITGVDLAAIDSAAPHSQGEADAET